MTMLAIEHEPVDERWARIADHAPILAATARSYIDQISVIFPEGGFNALSRLRSYVQEKMAGLRGEDGARAVTHIAEGRPYEEIVRLAAEQEADLIVIGTSVHASLFGGTPVLGSEIERVVRNAPCPVLCVSAGKIVTPIPARLRIPVPQT